MAKRVRVLIVDDSTVMRQLLSTVLSADPEIEVVGEAPDPLVARERIKALNPDVLTLDIEMPNMDGLSFLRKIMELRPMPVIMVSSLTQAGAEITFKALEIGAVDFIAKPTTNLDRALTALAAELPAKVKAAARARIGVSRAAPPAQAPRLNRPAHAREKIIAIGASTGGVEALKVVLMGLPAECPPILITQHLPAPFMSVFARQLGTVAQRETLVAENGMELLPDRIIVAPGDAHLTVDMLCGLRVVRLTHGPCSSGCLPSLDPMLASVGALYGASGLGVVLTGMGRDGVEGAGRLVACGGSVLAQDAASCAVWGMPRAVLEAGLACAVMPPDKIARRIASLAREMPCK